MVISKIAKFIKKLVASGQQGNEQNKKNNPRSIKTF